MKNKVIIILSIAAFIGGLLIFYQSRPVEQKTSATDQADQQTGVQNWPSKTDDQGQVSVKVTPRALSGAQWKFDIVFDAHSGSLDDDPLLVAVLVNDKGNTYQPTAWEGPGPGGHHREGVLVFQAIDPKPSYVEVKIKNVGDVSERTFKWNL